jgi:hypothetical protein
MTFIAKKAFPRRAFLRGAGATLALPLLDAMVPAMTAAAQTAAARPRRLGFVYVPHGVILNQWTPAATGSGFDLTRILNPLEPFKDSLAVVSNVMRPDGRGQDHACTGAWLTGVPPKRTDGADFLAGRSIDQIVADAIRGDTPIPSLEVATEDFTSLLGACMVGYSCAYMNTLSWQTPTTPLPMEINPRAVFERMFGWEGSKEQRAARLRSDRSVLDVIAAELADLEGSLGARDRARVDEYLDYVREIERRLQRTERQTDALLAVPGAPLGVPDSFEEHVSLMFDLLALACEADFTRVFTFMVSREFSQRTYPNLGVTEPHHAISHNNNREPQVSAHAKVNAYHMLLFARFLERLQATRDGDGSLLDHTTILYGSGMGDGNVHAPYPLPLVVIDRARRTPGGRHVAAPERTPLPNLLLTLADRSGVPLERFGISTGHLEI